MLAISVVLSLLVSTSSAEASPLDQVRDYREKHFSRILGEFCELLAIPNVARDRENIRKNAKWIQEAFEAQGASMKLLELDGAPPIVFGRLDTPGAERTLGIYVHYDGQPVDASQWAQSPWKPTLYSGVLEEGGTPLPLPAPGDAINPDWRLYGRATADDKAPIIAILGALEALRSIGAKLTSNFLFFFEGEEEAGSPHLAQYLEKYRDLLEVDGWLFCDGPLHQSGRPQLMFGVRGVCGMEIEVYGATRNLHSGHYGNWSPNPAMRLSQLLASMKDDEGHVLVEGYYDTITPLTEADRKAFDTIPDYDDALRAELGLARTEDNNAPYMERILLPSLNIKGFRCATVGRQARNIVPNSAIASMDLRLVEGNEPSHMIDLVEAHIRKQGYHIVREAPDLETRRTHPKIARVSRSEGYVAARTSMALPIAQQIIEATRRACQEPLVLLPTLGGSLPLYLFAHGLGHPTIIVPMANHDNNQHSPNENLRLGNLQYGIDLMAALFTM